MNLETVSARVIMLQQQVNVHVEQIESLANNLKILRGHLGEAQHWLNQLNAQQPAPELPAEGDNSNATKEGNEPEGDISEHQDGEGSGETTEPSGCDSVE